MVKSEGRSRKAEMLIKTTFLSVYDCVIIFLALH
jgi:hypothetical protein